MPSKYRNLHGATPSSAPTALVLIDVINDLEFPEGEQLLAAALPMSRALVQLRRRAKAAGIPVIYVNDNFGRWQSDLQRQVQHCLCDNVRGRPIVEQLKPEADDYFVLKPKHSAFYSTVLDILLRHLQVDRLILTGMAANICVLFTANDAYMRDLGLIIPCDCVASNSAAINRQALEMMQTLLKADIRPSTELDLEQLARPQRDVKTP